MNIVITKKIITLYKYIASYHRSGKVQCKKLRKVHTSTKLKHIRFFTMTILLSNNQYMQASSFHSAHLCTPMYVTITCMRLKHVLHFIIVLIAKYTGWWCCGSTQRMNYVIFISKQYTFPCYRASRSRGSARWLLFRTRIKPSVTHIVISVYSNSVFI